ncbi:hypothetical protein QJQ45_026059, partial [Haematococcus lacustris]
SLRELSARFFNQDEAFRGGDVLWSRGYEALMAPLAAGLDIVYGQNVTLVDGSSRQVVVRSASGAAWQAPFVICTFPLGVLKQSWRTLFRPALPARKVTAIQTLGMGLLNKVVLRFPTAFWDQDAPTDWMDWIPQTPGATFEFYSLFRGSGAPVLIAFSAGDYARYQASAKQAGGEAGGGRQRGRGSGRKAAGERQGERGSGGSAVRRAIEARSNSSILADVMALLRSSFDDVPEPLEVIITRWSQHPWSWGSYPFVKAGAAGSAYDTLAGPTDSTNRVFFAGDATLSTYPGTAHGAHLSGISEEEPDYKHVVEHFRSFAQRTMERMQPPDATAHLLLAQGGVVTDAYPLTNPTAASTLARRIPVLNATLNFVKSDSAGVTSAQLASLSDVTLVGPTNICRFVDAAAGLCSLAFGPNCTANPRWALYVNYPIWVPRSAMANISSGPNNVMASCRYWNVSDHCVDQEGDRVLWGYVMGVVSYNVLRKVVVEGLRWVLLVRPAMSVGNVPYRWTITTQLPIPAQGACGFKDSSDSRPLTEPVQHSIELEELPTTDQWNNFVLSAEPVDGWGTTWRHHQVLLYSLMPKKAVDLQLWEGNKFLEAYERSATGQALIPQGQATLLAQPPLSGVACSGTPAERLLDLLDGLLTNQWPSTQDVVALRMVVMQGARKLYQPEDITSRLNMMNSDVARNLLRELREPDTPWGAESRPGPGDDLSRSRTFVSFALEVHEEGEAKPLELDSALQLICTDDLPTGSMRPRSSLSYAADASSSITLPPRTSGQPPAQVELGLQPARPMAASLLTASARQGPDRVGAAALGAGDTLSLSITPRSKSTLRGALQALKAALNPSSPSSQGSPGRVQHGEDDEDEAEALDRADRSHHGAVNIGVPQCAPNPSPSAAYHAKTSRVVAMPPPVVEELHSLLEAAYSSWTYDSFALAAASQGHPLSALLYFLLHRSGLMTRFRLNPLMTARFARALEAGYQDQPYHNKIHAADVLQTLHVVLTRGGLVPGYADPLTLLACLLAGAAHDLQHSGLTNDFLVATEHPLALLYNDKSPAENHHLATLFSMLRCPELALLAHLPKQERDKMRKIIIELIMGTDMKQHFTITSSFANLHRLPAERVPLARISQDMKAIASQQHPAATGSSVKAPTDEVNRLLSLQVALKISDLGSSAETFEVCRASTPLLPERRSPSPGSADKQVHLCYPDYLVQLPAWACLPLRLQVNRRWVAALQDEFFAQGDQEKAAGLPVSALMDRDKPGAASAASQFGWYDFVAIPLFYNFTRVFPQAEPLMSSAMATYRWAQEALGPLASEQEDAAAAARRSRSLAALERKCADLAARAQRRLQVAPRLLEPPAACCLEELPHSCYCPLLLLLLLFLTAL